MPRKRGKLYSWTSVVAHNTTLGPDEALITLKADAGWLPEIARQFYGAPGAFAMLTMVPHDLDGAKFGLGRPYTPFAIETDGTMLIYAHAVGTHSRRLVASPAGTRVTLTGPMGLGWPNVQHSALFFADAYNPAPVFSALTHPDKPSARVFVLSPDAVQPALWSWAAAYLAANQTQTPITLPLTDKTLLALEPFLDKAVLPPESPDWIGVCVQDAAMSSALLAWAAERYPDALRLRYAKPTMACGTGSCYGCVEVTTGARVCWEGPVLRDCSL